MTGGQRRDERRAAVALAVAILAGIGLFIVYFAGGQTQIEGVLFAVAFGGLGIATSGVVTDPEARLPARTGWLSPAVEQRRDLITKPLAAEHPSLVGRVAYGAERGVI